MRHINFRALIACFIIFILGFAPVLPSLHSAVFSITKPVQITMRSASSAILSEWGFWLHFRSLKDDYALLEAKTVELEEDLFSLQSVEYENTVLRTQLGIASERPDLPALKLMARVVNVSTESGSSRILIDRGSIDNVDVGDVVVLGSSLVGAVSEVFSTTSQVRLLTDPRSKVSALDQSSPQRARGVVTGMYGTSLLLEDLLPREEIAIGDTVVSSGADSFFPAGLLLGKVSSVFSSDTDILKTAELDSVIDIRHLDIVFLMGHYD